MMANLSIYRKVLIAFGAILSVTVVAAGLIFFQSLRLQRDVVTADAITGRAAAFEKYRSALQDAHKTVLRLLNSSDIEYLGVLSDHLAAIDRERDDVLAQSEDGSSAHATAQEIAALVERWRRQVVERQIADTEDPYTVDIARLREESVQNRSLWDKIDSAFSRQRAANVAALHNAQQRQAGNLILLEVISLGSSLMVVIFCVMMAMMVRGSVVLPLRRLTDVTEKLRDHEWSVEITGVSRQDEIGDMSRALEVFREAGIENEQISARQVAEAEEKARQAQRVSEAVAEFRGQSSDLLRALADAGFSLGNAAHSLEGVAGDSFDYTQSVSSAAEATGSSVQSVAAAIEEMSMSIRDISTQLQNVARLTRLATEASAQADRKVSGLQTRSEQIHEVIDLINGIAGQINLLALNATIESARAGEAGKGFAVVAQQVKQLADQTGKATEDISRVIGQVSGDVSEVVQAIRTIDNAIGEVNTNSAAVSASVEEQSTALDEISRNVSIVSNQTRTVAGNVKGVESKVGETRSVAGNVSSLSDSLKESSERLGATIERFIGTVANDRRPTVRSA
ncbi:methyl-accepting chemotaxis protein [Acuticoccus mangrovi]|uniref:HAMP domain-containing protein n=1 Tax=Acuticoccus mangrovi TaxID=2796142 RepID=A0A934IMU5_9HYPH|nr:methyl-accepting chemotaxis protein [Acuticoccus mangrovi]MBJ3775283.1 HAMP domain-containing protein [Acuticoccus mangrovi]